MGALSAITDGPWKAGDEPAIAAALLGETAIGPDERDTFVALLPDELQDGVRDALSTARPDVEGLHRIVREADQFNASMGGQDADGDGISATFKIVPLSEVTGDKTPDQRPTIIGGLLREGGKMLIAGPPKSHKSMEAIALAMAFATGGEWMGHRCRRTAALYVNTELSETEFYNRVEVVRAALGVSPFAYADRFSAITLKGQTIGGRVPTAATLCQWLKRNVRAGEYGVVFIDPVYKLEDGPEDHEQVKALLDALDSLITALGCTVVYVHHTAKGGNAGKSVYEVARGSGDWGGDADLVCAISELSPLKEGSEAWEQAISLGIRSPEHSAYRIMFGPRSFPDVPSVDCFKTWPCFTADETGVLRDAKLRGAPGTQGGEAMASKQADARQRKDDAVSEAVHCCVSMGEEPTRDAVYQHLATTCRGHGIARPSEDGFKAWTSRPGGLTHWRMRKAESGAWVLAECYQEPDGRAVYRDGEPLFLPGQNRRSEGEGGVNSSI